MKYKLPLRVHSNLGNGAASQFHTSQSLAEGLGGMGEPYPLGYIQTSVSASKVILIAPGQSSKGSHRKADLKAYKSQGRGMQNG